MHLGKSIFAELSYSGWFEAVTKRPFCSTSGTIRVWELPAFDDHKDRGGAMLCLRFTTATCRALPLPPLEPGTKMMLQGKSRPLASASR